MKVYDFMGHRKLWGSISAIAVALSLVVIMTVGVKKSVDFAGGTQITVSFVDGTIETGNLRERVASYDNKAAIVKAESKSGSLFSIKIKNPDVEKGKEAEASLERLRKLEKIFASYKNDETELLDKIRSSNQDEIFRRLLAENPYGIVSSDAEKNQVYNNLAARLVSQLPAASDLDALAQAVDPANALKLAQALQFNFPALNRITENLLASFLAKYDPLGRGANADYSDIAAQVEATRAANNDYLPSLETALAAIKVKDGENVQALQAFFTKNFTLGSYKIIANDTFSPTIANEMLSKAFTAVLLSLIGILIYVSVRFQLGFAVAAVAALFHDVIIALGCFAIAGRELSSPVIAAFLTIVGYSLNDTIVVFDRIRDDLRTHKGKDMLTEMNHAINQTLSRTIMTSGTTMIVVVVLFLSANETLRDFAFPLLIGITVGTYSSIFVASPLTYWWHQKVRPVTV